MKRSMSVRPVFHWTDSKMRVHAAICYAALSLLVDENNDMQYLLSSQSDQVQRFPCGVVGAKLRGRTVPLFSPVDT